MHWWYPTLPENASSFGGDVDALFYVILYITGAIFLVVEIALLVFLFKYRARPGRRAEYIEGSTAAEVIWTTIPALIVIALGVFSQPLWSRIKDPARIPSEAVPIGVLAKQFEWHFTYPGPDGQLDTDDDFTKRGELHVVVDQPVRFRLTAEEVIHSFFIPVFRLKQDAVPGMTIEGWFRPTQTGEWEIACAELCGLGHYRMRGRVWVHTAEEFAQWQASQLGPAAPAADTTTSARGAS
jgi:cytochrome c oxidase subunit 2